MTRLAMSLLLLALAGCTTTCRIDSSVSGAQVYLDNRLVGVSPCDIELDDNKTSYMLKLEHPDCHPWQFMISQMYAGSISQQQTQTNVVGSSSAYGVGNGVNTNTNVYGTQNTQTYNTPVYAWPERYYVTLARKSAPTPTSTPAAPPPANTTTTTPASSQQRGAFCSGCGKQFTGDAQFCSGCGARR